MSLDLETELAEEYACERPPEAGDFYVKIREYQGTGNKALEERWWALLKAISATKEMRLRHLINQKDKTLRNAFDVMMLVPALRSGFKIGVLHEMEAMRCPEVKLSSRS